MDYKSMSYEQLVDIENRLLTKMNAIMKEREILAEEHWQKCDKPGVVYSVDVDNEIEARQWAKEEEYNILKHEHTLVNIWKSKHKKQ